MVPRLAAPGSSFKGAYLYYFHDKDALTQARIAWTETINLLTDKVEKAWKVMAFTAKHQDELKEASGQKRSGAKLKKPVLAYFLSWHPEQKPDRKTMMEAAYSSLEELGLGEHEAMVACHTDEPHPHLHVVVNKAHPRTGLVAKLKFTKRKLQDWARKFQEKEGTMYCPKREENHAKRKKGQSTRYGDPKIIEAWEASQSGAEFQQQLKQRGYDLAKGRKRLVVVDPYGKTLNPVRMLPDVKAAKFNQRIADLEPQSLPTPKAVLKTRSEQPNEKAEPSQEDASPVIEDDTQDPATTDSAEEKILDAIDRMSERHRQESERFEAQNRSRHQKRKIELSKHYKLMERKEAITTLKDKPNAPSIVPKFARRLFGMDQKTKAQLEKLQSAQIEAIQRIKTTLKKIETREDRSLQVIENRHAREMQTLARRLESLQSPRYSEPDRDHSERESPGNLWVNDEPTLSR